MNADAPIRFADEPRDQETQRSEAWNVLVVDDDADVHTATQLALVDANVLGRGLRLTHAHSAEQAFQILRRAGDGYFGVVLLDVVMETTHAGLELVQRLRGELGIAQTRVILRTGQPGLAPETRVLNEYEIDDYHTKSELTRRRLLTTLTTSIRAFRQLGALNRHRAGLEQIVSAISTITQHEGVAKFANGVLEQLSVLLGEPVDGLICMQPRSGAPAELTVVSGVGRHAQLVGQPVARVSDSQVKGATLRALGARSHLVGPDHVVLYVESRTHEGAMFVATRAPLDSLNLQLVRTMATNIVAGFSNAALVESVRRQAHQDRVTGLPNRASFAGLLNIAAQSATPQTVALLDIRDFGDVYHALGRETGTSLLENIADRLREDFSGCAIGRIGADVFGIIGPSARVVPPLITRTFAMPFEVGMHSLQVDVAVGLAPVEPQADGEELLRRADLALSEAKTQTDADYLIYNPRLDESVAEDVRLIGKMRRAFEAGELTLYFQPKIDIQTGEIVAAEALARWPTRNGFISPGRFIPLAERSGLIRPLGRWALHQAAAAAAELRTIKPSMEVAVNVSVAQLRRRGLKQDLLRALGEAQVAADALTLEVTETSFASTSDDLIKELEELRALGTRISLDDFGTGYASFGYLRWLPIDELKLDKLFVDGVTSVDGSLLCRTIVDLGHALGFKIVAEGVEQKPQVQFLKAMGVHQVQGFLFARPMPLEDLKEMLRAKRG